MTVKKMRRVAEEPSPSPSYRDDARRRFRFQSLSQDYTEFLEETEEKKRRLLEARLRKRKLFAEARFLRRKLETLFANPYQQVGLKEPSSKTPVIKPPTEKKPRVSEAARTSNYSRDNLYANASQYQFKKMSQKKPTKSLCVAQSSGVLMEAANASTSATLGANEVSFKNGEELNKFHLEQYHIQMERLNRVPMIGGSNEMLAICRDLGNNSKKTGKRKLSWGDPLVLKA
ncbi:uncharacterized protein LOC122038837 [Zingiber officinale]|uniref:Uncharacterized protein n=1 Tax=Zingiber officinale TaxID=94328 RepID=A0A8J5LX96_ZINOF|nr:uncharacterized protein LOC122038837 [Zingiber officinale]XP_042454724.1 uncharacterized protein LOC122038837 [Zingiber officinale]KAG6539118.1 hypothetical protein ZIOFF_004271 [Zingiber officinale]